MTGLRVMLVAFVVAALGVVVAADEKKPDKASDNAKLIIGTWEVTKADKETEASIGDTIEFTKDGKYNVRHTDSTATMTLNTYSHVMMGTQSQAAAKLDGGLSRSSPAVQTA
jgi:uncharacterized protein (TIGR03066 family)